jgi:drug/metabolite transporter (DMT)-like permease
MPISEILALASAVCIAASGMLISELSGKVDVLRLARWQMLAAVTMTAAVSIAVGGWRSVAPWHFGYLAASSLFGIMIASTTYFAAIYTAGPRVTALLFSLTSPFALALGYLFLGETITLRQGAGVALVLSGIVLAVGASKPRLAATAPQDLSPLSPVVPTAPVAVPWKGIVLGVVTALGQALGSLCARPAMADGVEPFTAMAIRSGLAALFFLALALVPLPALRQAYRFRPSHLAIACAAAFFGTGLGMSLLMAALANGNVGLVSTLSSMTPVVILPMAWARSGIAPPARAWAGAALAVVGTALISL